MNGPNRHDRNVGTFLKVVQMAPGPPRSPPERRNPIGTLAFAVEVAEGILHTWRAGEERAKGTMRNTRGEDVVDVGSLGWHQKEAVLMNLIGTYKKHVHLK